MKNIKKQKTTEILQIVKESCGLTIDGICEKLDFEDDELGMILEIIQELVADGSIKEERVVAYYKA